MRNHKTIFLLHLPKTAVQNMRSRFKYKNAMIPLKKNAVLFSFAELITLITAYLLLSAFCKAFEIALPATKQAAASTAPFTPTNATINAITPDAPIDCARP